MFDTTRMERKRTTESKQTHSGLCSPNVLYLNNPLHACKSSSQGPERYFIRFLCGCWHHSDTHAFLPEFLGFPWNLKRQNMILKDAPKDDTIGFRCNKNSLTRTPKTAPCLHNLRRDFFRIFKGNLSSICAIKSFMSTIFYCEMYRC